MAGVVASADLWHLDGEKAMVDMVEDAKLQQLQFRFMLRLTDCSWLSAMLILFCQPQLEILTPELSRGFSKPSTLVQRRARSVSTQVCQKVGNLNPYRFLIVFGL